MIGRVDVEVGRKLKARRRLIGMSQEALALQCGVSFQQIHKYEEAICRVSAAMLWRLACALEVEMSYFFETLDRERDGVARRLSAPMASPLAATA